MSKPQSVPLSDIRLDGGTQTRAAISEPSVVEYAQDMQDGHKFPPVILFNDGAALWLADGFHRFHAAARCAFNDILAEVRTGTRSDAVKFALGANRSNGLRRTNQDKRRCVQIAVDEFPELSDRAIAELCGVGHPLVAEMRPVQLEESSTSTAPTTRTGRDGKNYPAPKATASEPIAEPPQEEPTDTQEPRQSSPRYVPADGLKYAELAILNLEKIQPNDTQREAAFRRVTNWIAKNTK